MLRSRIWHMPTHFVKKMFPTYNKQAQFFNFKHLVTKKESYSISKQMFSKPVTKSLAILLILAPMLMAVFAKADSTGEFTSSEEAYVSGPEYSLSPNPSKSAGLTAVVLKVFLEGPFDNGSMKDELRSQSLISTTDPYGMGASAYPGAFNVTGAKAVVDWIKVIIRDPSDATVKVDSAVALLQADGTVIDPFGDTKVTFPVAPNGDYYVEVAHYNHLSVMSANTLDLSVEPTLDLTLSSTATYSNGGQAQRDINGTMCMWSGDASQDGSINVVDKNDHWRLENAQTYQYGTIKADLNLDGIVNAIDKNDYWRVNNSRAAQLP